MDYAGLGRWRAAEDDARWILSARRASFRKHGDHAGAYSVRAAAGPLRAGSACRSHEHGPLVRDRRPPPPRALQEIRGQAN